MKKYNDLKLDITLNVDHIIFKLLSNENNVRKNENKNNILSLDEIKALCICAKILFINQPMLLELQSPINIVGILKKAIFMGNTKIYSIYLKKGYILHTPIIYF